MSFVFLFPLYSLDTETFLYESDGNSIRSIRAAGRKGMVNPLSIRKVPYGMAGILHDFFFLRCRSAVFSSTALALYFFQTRGRAQNHWHGLIFDRDSKCLVLLSD